MTAQHAKRNAVARAICTACQENPDHHGDARGNQYRWQDYLEAADAAMAAMSVDATTVLNKDGVAIKVGQVWRDMDRRMDSRHCRVIAVKDGRAHMSRCAPNGQLATDAITKVAIARMHRSSTGWELVLDAGEQPLNQKAM